MSRIEATSARDLANFLAELGQQDLQAQGSGRSAGLLLAYSE